MATTAGTLTSKVSSTVSSPTVNYSATYTATRASETTSAVSVVLNFSAWLNSSASKLGTGIKLTIYARINGGVWQSAVIKSTSVSWSGTTKHNASITLTGDTDASTAKIDFYVSRTGSTYGGSAGILGSASNPKSYTSTLPTYKSGGGDTPTPTPTPTPTTEKYIYVKINGAWKQAVSYVKINGVWKKTAPYIRVNGTWESV